MKRSICLILSAAVLAGIPSCGLIRSVLKIPVGIVKTAGRTVGLSNLTDDKPQPEHGAPKDGELPDADDQAASGTDE